ncbi:MAG: hypothetical protein IKA47_12205 [Oscillospiraceae bacterium]|nr:hypothetical protein [Oscillospiraceae bacterium]
MKNIFKIIAVVLVFCTLFMGCSSAPDPENTTGAPTTFPQESTVGQTETPTTPPTTEATVPPTTEATVPPTVEVTEPTTFPTEPGHIHTFSEATCSQPKTCTCGATEGAPIEHKYVDGVCSVCEYNDPDYANTMVWIPTNGGTKYHRHAGCSSMEDPEYVTKGEAEYLGFEPCKKCFK